MQAQPAPPVYHFSNFDEFIRKELPTAKKAGPQYTGDINSKAAALKAEGARVIDDIRHAALLLGSREEIIQFIEKQQMAITMLADLLLPYLPEGHAARVTRCTATPSVTNLVKRCYQSLEEQLVLLDRFFPGFISEEVKLPELFFTRHCHSLQRAMEYYTQELLMEDADPDLVAIAMFPLQEFLARRNDRYSSFAMVSYYDRLFREMEDLLEIKDSRRTMSQRLFRRLYYLNHNSMRFFLHCQDYCNRKIDAEETTEGKLLAIKKLQKKMLELPQQPGSALRHNRESLDEQLGALLKSQQAILLQERNMTEREPTAQEQKELLHAGWSQPEWAYLVKALKETGAIKTENAMQICRVFAGILVNKLGRVASPNSFKNDYDHTDLDLCDKVIEKLQLMINFVMKDKRRIKNRP